MNAHTRKNGRTGDVSDVAGSVQRTGQADSVLMLEGEKLEGRTVATKVVFAKLREEPDEYPLPVTFAITGDELRTSTVTNEEDGRPIEVRIVEQLESGGEDRKRPRHDPATQRHRRAGGHLEPLRWAPNRQHDGDDRGRERKAFELRKTPDFGTRREVLPDDTRRAPDAE